MQALKTSARSTRPIHCPSRGLHTTQWYVYWSNDVASETHTISTEYTVHARGKKQDINTKVVHSFGQCFSHAMLCLGANGKRLIWACAAVWASTYVNLCRGMVKSERQLHHGRGVMAMMMTMTTMRVIGQMRTARKMHATANAIQDGRNYDRTPRGWQLRVQSKKLATTSASQDAGNCQCNSRCQQLRMQSKRPTSASNPKQLAMFIRTCPPAPGLLCNPACWQVRAQSKTHATSRPSSLSRAPPRRMRAFR